MLEFDKNHRELICLANFITPVTSLTGGIKQSPGVGIDSFSCSLSQYTFGTIEITTSQINPDVKYFYSIWIPLNGVGGTMTNMTIDAGIGAACTTNIINNGIPDPVLAGTNVTVTSGAVIPAGTYRVLWVTPNLLQVPAPPQTNSIFIKGNTKY